MDTIFPLILKQCEWVSEWVSEWVNEWGGGKGRVDPIGRGRRLTPFHRGDYGLSRAFGLGAMRYDVDWWNARQQCECQSNVQINNVVCLFGLRPISLVFTKNAALTVMMYFFSSGIQQSFALLPCFSRLGKHGCHCSGFSRGMLIVTDLIGCEAAWVIGRHSSSFAIW